jgi:hypothetical protein
VTSRRIDALTQRWVIRTGRRVDLLEMPWLQGPVGDREVIGDAWLLGEAERLGAAVGPAGHAGLLPCMDQLDGPGFDAGRLHPAVRDFYDRTSSWRLGVSVKWSLWAWPMGWLVAAVFARRLEQLALPLRRRDVADGMTSVVTPLLKEHHQVGARWLRRSTATGSVIYSGLYDTTQPPDARRPYVRVCFPLPQGRLVVLLAADVVSDGGLRLSSGVGGWGEPGAYLVVERADGAWARRVPLHETFHVYVAVDGTLRTDHNPRFRRLPVVDLRYRMTPLPGRPALEIVH